MDFDDSESRVRRLLSKYVSVGGEFDVDRELPLLGAQGILDSVAALELVLALETEFRILVTDEEICPANLRSLDAMVRFVSKKRKS